MSRQIAPETVARLPGHRSVHWWSQMVLLGGLGAAWLSPAEAVVAQSYQRPASRNGGMQATSSNVFVDTIRRLKREARQAALQDDLVTARRAAEQAHQYALDYQSALTSFPDCAPEATAELLRQYSYNSSVAPMEGQTISEKSNQLKSSLSKLSDDMPEVRRESGAMSDNPNLSPVPGSQDRTQIRKASSVARKKKVRRPAPRMIPDDEEATAAVVTPQPVEQVRQEPEFTFFTSAIRPSASGQEPTAEERERFRVLQSEGLLNVQSPLAAPLRTPPQPITTNAAPETPSAEADYPAPSAGNPSVTTALGRTEDARMELDLDSAAEDDQETRWPEWLEPKTDAENGSQETPKTSETAEESVSVPTNQEQTAAEVDPSAPVMDVQTFNEAFDSDLDAGDAAFFAEPDSESAAEPQSAEPASMTRVTYTAPQTSGSAAPEVPALLGDEQPEPSAPQSLQTGKPTVACHDILAVEWTAAGDDLTPAAAAPTPRFWKWDSLTSKEKVALAGGAFLLIGGLLFAMSFRRDSRSA